MADFSISNYTLPVGINNDEAKREDMTLKQFSGEILASYEKKKLVSGMVHTKNIKNGKSAQFPLTGRATAGYFDTIIDPKGIKTAERTINIDALMISSTMIPSFDQMLAHYDNRTVYSKELGEALANACELHTFIELAKVSHAVKRIDDADQVDGQWLSNDKFRICTGGAADRAELAANVLEGLFVAGEIMEAADVEIGEGLIGCLPSGSYNALVMQAAINGLSYINKDVGGEGSVAKGKIPELAGVNLFRAPKMPKTDVTSTGVNKYHYGDFTKLAGMVFKGGAVGRLNLLEVQVEKEYMIAYQATLCLAKLACGMGGLRPEEAVAFELAAVTNQTI